MAYVSKVKVPSGTTYTIKDSTARSNATSAMKNIATIESSSTASKAYSVGDYLVHSNILYKVISAISSGETLTPYTNIVATTTGAELTAVTDSIVYRNFTVMGNGTTRVDKSVALSGYTPFVAIPTGAIGDLTAMTELYNNSISGNTATFMWQNAKASSVGIGFMVIYKKIV